MTIQITKPENFINLGVGQPDPDLLPVSLFNEMSLCSGDLAYGAEAGDKQFRCTLSTWLSAEYGRHVDADQLLITNGCSNALDMICTGFAVTGDTVLVEDPSYFLALKLFAGHGLKVVAVPMDDQGIDLDALEIALQRYSPAFIYTIPSYHNPSGITQPDARRAGLVALSKRYQCLLVADEVYQCLYFDQRPSPPLACYDVDAPVLSIGSFSKILAPGLRLGWIQGAGKSLETLLGLALLDSGGGLAPIASAIVEPLIADGRYQDYLSGLRRTYSSRQDALLSGLREVFGCELDIHKPGGGYFLWATFRSGINVIDKLADARRGGVSYLGGSLFSADKRFGSSMRLCFAWYAEEQLSLACQRLRRVFDSFSG